jgi:glutamate---cysteine ligase / carboxylate-amine ligase
VIPHAFGQSERWSVGIEEELFVLDAETLEPAPFPREAFEPPRIKAELFASVVELNTGVCASVPEAVVELAELRRRAKERAASAGLALGAAGTWPTAVPEDQAITEDEGYRRFLEYAGSSAQRQYCSGMHVHVGMESPEECMAALESILRWLPVLLAVSANSPYLAGRETGLVSTRAEILGLLPRSAAPPVLGSYSEWEAFAERLLKLGLADSYTRIWWDIRPHPRFGTLEVRMADQPTSSEAAGALAGLARALVSSFDEGDPTDRGAYAENRWAALRFGREAMLIHPEEDRLASIPELLDELTARLGAEVVDAVRALDQAGDQLAVGRAEGLHALCGHLIRLT